MRVRSALGARARGLRCGAATAGKGFGVDAEAMEMDEEDDDGMEEIDFDYAAEVVRETWELFAETGPEEQLALGKFFFSVLSELSPETQAVLDKHPAQEELERAFTATVSVLVAATADTRTLPAVVAALISKAENAGVEPPEVFPLAAQAVLVTLDEFFAAGEFSQPVEDAWVTVLGVVDQLVLDPTGDYFVEDDNTARQDDDCDDDE